MLVELHGEALGPRVRGPTDCRYSRWKGCFTLTLSLHFVGISNRNGHEHDGIQRNSRIRWRTDQAVDARRSARGRSAAPADQYGIAAVHPSLDRGDAGRAS